MSDPRTISAFFQDDHNRLDVLFQSFQTLKQEDLAKAKEAFTQFRSGLERHIRWEEEFLFPLWEDKTGMSESGPTFVMRHEHRQIEEQLQAIDRHLTGQNAGDPPVEQALLTVLSAHNLKEERVLYPAIDQVTTPEERGDLLRKIQAPPDGRMEK
jgi:iron-sulfur cluster repair protein YtfE (RIC family)